MTFEATERSDPVKIGMLQSFYIFNKSGMLMFHQQIAPSHAGHEQDLFQKGKIPVNKASGRKAAHYIAEQGHSDPPDPKLVGRSSLQQARGRRCTRSPASRCS